MAKTAEAEAKRITEKSAQVTSVEARHRLAELLGAVQFGGESITITRNGRPAARLVPVEEA
jgi:prevent-host-death family protein